MSEVDTLSKGCPTLLLAIDCPAKFSSNSNQTHLKQLIKVFRIENQRQVCLIRVGAKLCRTVNRQEQVWHRCSKPINSFLNLCWAVKVHTVYSYQVWYCYRDVSLSVFRQDDLCAVLRGMCTRCKFINSLTLRLNPSTVCCTACHPHGSKLISKALKEPSILYCLFEPQRNRPSLKHLTPASIFSFSLLLDLFSMQIAWHNVPLFIIVCAHKFSR